MSVRYTRPLAIAFAATTLAASISAPSAAEKRHDVTSSVEAERVDRVDVSAFAWKECEDFNDPAITCAGLDVPMDYDKPNGQKYTLRIAKLAAAQPDKKVGTLFVNPGGPGGSSVRMVQRAHTLPEELRNRFDIVGIDPRGIGGSHIANCFGNSEDLQKFRDQVTNNYHPINGAEITDASKYGVLLAKACAKHNATVLNHMSSAQVARDMDVVRRAIGEQQLTYLGLSYGTYIGQVYANLFPDRVRALALDGVVNGTDWNGTNHNARRNQDRRLFSAIGAEAALKSIFAECTNAGPSRCELAPANEESPTAQQRFDTLFAGVKEKERGVDYDYDDDGVVDYTERVRYDILAGELLNALYTKIAPQKVANMVTVWEGLLALAKAQEAGDKNAKIAPEVRQYLNERRLTEKPKAEEINDRAATYLGVACSDGRHPAKVGDNAMQAWDAQHWAPVFGQLWAWSSVPCSPNNWKPQDASAYLGDFRKTPANPLLFVGNLHDPATYHRQATFAARRSPGAGMVLANNYGHIALGKSKCATDAVVSYLVEQKLERYSTCFDAPAAFPAADTEGEARVASTPEDELVVPLKPLGLLMNG